MANGKPETNGNGATPVVSLLDQAREAYKVAGGKDPTDGGGKLLKAWVAAKTAAEKATAILEAAKKAESETVLALARAYGARSLNINGVLYDFASRGDTVFFRRKGGEVVELSL